MVESEDETGREGPDGKRYVPMDEEHLSAMARPLGKQTVAHCAGAMIGEHPQFKGDVKHDRLDNLIQKTRHSEAYVKVAKVCARVEYH